MSKQLVLIITIYICVYCNFTTEIKTNVIRRKVDVLPRRQNDRPGRNYLVKRSFNYVYPGTKWCGINNIAKNYEDLGFLKHADACCREHDHCPESIPPRSTKYGLHNDGPFTRSHCDCDQALYGCLKRAKSTSANAIGNIFFNIGKMTCFACKEITRRRRSTKKANRLCRNMFFFRNHAFQ